MRLPNFLMALTPVELEQLLAGAVKQASRQFVLRCVNGPVYTSAGTFSYSVVVP